MYKTTIINNAILLVFLLHIVQLNYMYDSIDEKECSRSGKMHMYM